MKVVRALLTSALALTTIAVAASPATAATTLEAPSQDGRVVVSTTTITDLNSGHVAETTTTTTLDKRGNAVRSSLTQVVDGDLVSSEETSTTYGIGNRVEKKVTVSDADGDGSQAPDTKVEVLSYDKRGNLVSVVTTNDVGSNGSIDTTLTSTVGRDGKGRVITAVEEDELGTRTSTITYDARGRDVSSSMDIDLASTPQPLDFRSVTTTTYNSAGSVSAFTIDNFTFDDQGTSTLSYASTTTMAYNSRGDVVLATTRSDNDGDATVDNTTTEATTYDSKARITDTVTTSATVGSSTIRSTSHNVYDKAGNRTSSVFDTFMDGVLIQHVKVTNTYDGRNRLVTSVLRGEDGSGTIFTTITTTFSYDSQGRVIQYTETRTQGDGTVSSSQVTTSVYTSSTVTSTTAFDDNGDGNTDRIRVDVTPL